jgi:hypothetical protein
MVQVCLVLVSSLLAAAAGLATPQQQPDTTSFISNVVPRRNSTGEVIDAHDGSYQQWGGPGNPWYYYAMGYGLCKQPTWYCSGGCGYGYSWIGIWKSRRLSTNGTWEMVRSEARAPGWPDAVYFRVHVVFQARTGTYVMWVNVDGAPECPTPGCDRKTQGCTCYFVGTSKSPDGPFEYRGARTTRYVAPGDIDILVEGDDAYIIYTATLQNHGMSVEKLSADWLSSLAAPNASSPSPTSNSSGLFGDRDVEAPAIFRRGETYYALFGQCCCFCSQGSGITVQTASHPLGPWTSHGNIGCAKHTAADGTCADSAAPLPCDPHGAGNAPAACRSTVTQAQQNGVIPVHTDAGVQFLWNGDRWQSAADGEKGHDLQYTAPLVWEHDPASGLDLPKQLAWVDSFTMEIR